MHRKQMQQSLEKQSQWDNSTLNCFPVSQLDLSQSIMPHLAGHAKTVKSILFVYIFAAGKLTLNEHCD